VSVDDAFAPPGDSWITGNIQILSGADQVTTPVTIGGFNGLKATASYINVADNDYTEWADDDEIDILMEVYGDAAVLSTQGEPRDFNFLIGTLPEIDSPAGGQIPVEGKNRKWNWVLFRIPNTLRPSDGEHRVGSIPANAQGATAAGGVNGGTIRIQSVPNLIVRVIAFGEKGAFGEPEQINVFASPDQCAPEPATNLAWIDFASSQTNNLVLLNDQDQTSTVETGIGPDGDKRRAARPTGTYLNFGVTSNYLGFPCNDAHTVKICVEYYDDPALAGTTFGPDTYATDDQGGLGTVADDQRQTLAGTGTWQRRSWTVPAVNLFGVNTAPLTGGPRLSFDTPVYISQYNLGIYRTGTNALAGQEPIPDCFADPDFCKGTYGNFAEMDLATGQMNGLEPGTSGGDQEMIQEEAGPADDRRMAVRPALSDGTPGFAHNYLNFAITGESLGPTSQPGVRLAICMTYYDDPALTNATFRPDVYISDAGGNVAFAFPPSDLAVHLQGTGTWRDAYFELPDVKFTGVNQGPQAAARFTLSDKIFVSRVRYGVIRPCGPDANVNPLEECKPPAAVTIAASRNADGTVRLSWAASPAGFTLQENTNAGATGWTASSATPVAEGTDNVVTVTPSGTKFFRLVKP
jgi:hypothetical protein